MDPRLDLLRRGTVVLVLLATPAMAYLLVAGAMTADAGLAGWFLLVAVPLSLLGTGLVLMAGANLRLPISVRDRN
ncbi:hypothetical protein [Halomicrococcus gelatinilyticus]|uniref:hypothetical protein n=1 Tax=Halomicrococcus gelatinilyticus TaxID=1702103 RepID=UPI002E136937